MNSSVYGSVPGDILAGPERSNVHVFLGEMGLLMQREREKRERKDRREREREDRKREERKGGGGEEEKRREERKVWRRHTKEETLGKGPLRWVIEGDRGKRVAFHVSDYKAAA